MFDPGGNLKVAMAICMDKNMDNEAGIRRPSAGATTHHTSL